MTGNDFREDGWQDTKMRKLGFLGGVGGSPAPGQLPQKAEARKDT